MCANRERRKIDAAIIWNHLTPKLIAGESMIAKTAQLNIRCAPSTADALKALAESERLPLGEVVQLLLDRFQPTPDESIIDGWKAGIEERINELELQVKALSVESKPKASRSVEVSGNPSLGPEAGSFKEAVIQCYQSGITSFQEIANRLAAQGYRNSSGNLYHRKQVARIIAGMK